MHLLKKLLRDLVLRSGRTSTIVLAIALGLFGFFAVTSAHGVLTREIRRNYLETTPASLTLMVDRASTELLHQVRKRPDVSAATRRKTVVARYRNTPQDPLRHAQIFIVDEFRGAQVAELLPREQVKTPAVGTVLIERSARAQLNLGVGERFELQLPGGRPKSVGIAGFVHEPALAPAKTEQAIYAYMSAETARVLGMSTPFDELRILVRHHPGDRDAIEQTATNIARWVTAQGLAQVHSIRVPPPLRHPHETQMTAILSLFVVFSTVILLLSCMLGATLINAWMTRQVREMGVMKALGARTPRLVLAYTLTTLTLSVLALIVAWLPGKLGGLAMAKSVTNVLNFDLASAKVPARIMAVQLGVALGLPILLAMPHIVRACRVSVKTALADHGQAQASASNAWLERWMSKFDSVLPKRLSYTLRGTLRRRRQFALSWGLFVVAGGGFVCAMTVAEAWDVLLKEVDRTRHYAVEVRLNTAPDTAEPDTAQLAARLKTLPGVAQVEVWQTAPVAESRPGQPAIERTYPDESHGTFHLVAGPSGTRLLTVPVHDGHGLTAQDDLSAVVINQFVPSFDRLRIGDTITLSIAGASRALRVVGKTVQVGVGATAYVGAGAFSQLVPRAEQQQQLWVASKVPLTAGTLDAFVADLEAELTVAGADVSSVVPVSLVKNAMAAHFEVLIYSLLALAVLIGGVGALGLGSALGVSLSERTRELGVLRALGATGRDVRNSVIVEGVLIGGLSIGLAVLAGFGLALLVGDVVGRMSFRVPLPPTLSLRAVAAWTLGALALGAVGGLLPALRAQKLSVRAALAWFLALATVGTVWLLPTPAAASATHGPLALGLPVPQRNVTIFQQIKRQTRDGRRR